MPAPSLKQKVGFLVAGLQLPILVVLGLFASNTVTNTWSPFWRTLAILLGASAGFVLGSLILWWLALRLYRRNSSP